MSCVDEIQEIPSSSSNEILAAARREAAFLTDKEREIILGVLTKDEQLRRQQQIKVMHLKAELQNLRRKGALKVSADWDSTGPDPDRSCGRCRVELGRVINRGAYCRTCRLKVCKGCREYNFRATDWVCTVCYKRMEIQAASGDWMNEFVRRPSRRRDARVYVPAADIIKRTIRRSWTISSPTPRWAALRTSPELRPYNSLPRGQDINNYPSLALHQKSLRSTDTTIDALRKSPTRRAQSEDVYDERNVETSNINNSHESVSSRNIQNDSTNQEQILKRPVRVNPLMSLSLRENKENRERRKSPRRKTESELETGENPSKCVQIEKDETTTSAQKHQEPSKQEQKQEEKQSERHVSFDNNSKTSDLFYLRSRSLSQSKSSKEVRKIPFSTRSLPEEGCMRDETIEHNSENAIVELCDIEPLSGTVFRKMTVRRRRQENMRKIPAVDAGWRRPPDPDLFDILLPGGDDYRLVFVNSDSSSKEEDVDDNDSSSASSFPIDECDWDYFEPGVTRPQQVLGWGSPFGSPRVYRKRLIDSPLGSPLLQRRPRIRESSDEDAGAPSPSETLAHPRTPPRTVVEPAEAMHCVHQSTIGQQTDQTRYPVTCKTCGGCATTPAAQYIPVPVPIPIPFPVPWGTSLPNTSPNNVVPLYKSLPNLPRSGTNAQASDFWQFLAQVQGFPWAIFDKPMIDEKVTEKNDDKGDAGEGGKEERSKDGDGEEVEPRGHLECENRGSSASDSTSTDSSEDEGEDQPRVRRVYNVTGPPSSRESDDALPSSNVTTDNEDEIDHKSSADEKEREEEEETSSGSADTDSNDTGTVADQKPKRFSRVFVVNHKGSSSSSSGSVTSSSGDYDSSDNDTDTELDCSVVLTNVKQIDFENDGNKDDANKTLEEEKESGAASFLRMRYLDEDKDDRNCDNSEETARSVASTSSGRKQSFESARDGSSRKIRTRARRSGAKTKRKQEDESNRVDNNNAAIMDESRQSCDKVSEAGGEARAPIHKSVTFEADTETLSNEKHEKVPKNDQLQAKHTKEGDEAKGSGNLKDNLEEIAKFIDNESKHSSVLHVSKISENDDNKKRVDDDFCLSNADQKDCDKNDSDMVEEDKKINNSLELEDKGLVEKAEKSFCENDQANLDVKEDKSLECTSCSLNSILLDDPVANKLSPVDSVIVNEDNSLIIAGNESLANKNNNRGNDTNQDEFLGLKIIEYQAGAAESDKSATTNTIKAEVNDTVLEPCEITRFNLSNVISDVSDKERRVAENNGTSVKGFSDEVPRNVVDSATVVEASTLNTGSSGDDFSSGVGDGNKFRSSEPIVIGTAVMRSEESKRNVFSESKSAYETYLDELSSKYRTDYTYSSSPGLSDVSAESLSSSDVEKESSRSRKELEWGHQTKSDIAANAKRAIKTKNQFTARNGDDARRDAAGKRETGGLPGACSNHTGVLPSSVNGEHSQVNNGRNGGAAAAAKYTSLVMITNNSSDATYQQVNVVTSDTTKVVPGENQVVVVSHTNRQDEPPMGKSREPENSLQSHPESNVTVITSAETLSAFEEGLADDDSWVENLSHDGDNDDDNDDDDDDDDFPTNSISENSSSGDEVTLTCSAAIDQEDELRGYHRAAIDFTLHTIVEESCEESEVEQAPRKARKERPGSATDLEKYFFFGLGDGTIPSINSNREDAFSETSSIYSEGMESLGGAEENQNDCPEELASSRLEKYFLSGFMGFTAERRDSDGSVGSDSEGKPSPEQRRKRLVRARGTGRSHSNSLDNLLGNPDLAGSEQQLEAQNNSEDSSSSDSDTYDDMLGFEKSDGQFDTVKRKNKAKKQKASLEDIKNLGITQEEQEGRDSDDDDERNKTPQPEVLSLPSNLTTNKIQQSRDSGFVGSCDDLLKDQRDINKSPDIMLHHEKITENVTEEKQEEKLVTESVPPATNLTRKDSFNNWSSDEETNLMMSKMRQFFKTMVANSQSSKPTTPNLSARTSPKPFPRAKTRCKPPQLVYFENELTRLMKTVPGIRDDQVREIVEYLSSEDTWSDSYDSSDYTSSDLEGASTKSALQQQISDSCKQIINKFDVSAEDEEGDAGDGGIIDESHGLNKETAFVYQKLVASFEKMATEDHPASTSGPNSPPLIAKVMHHIGSRLVALMHEVSSGESHASNSPKARNYHRRLQQKLSNASTTTTTTDEDSTSDTNLPDTFVEGSLSNYNMLPRSRSHDLLMGDGNKNLNQSISGVSEISEEREASDCERFSWRGSFESALLATDSRNRLSLIGGEGSASASALAIAAKRRSAGDLLFSHKSLSREQLDRVRSCGSIGGGNSEDKLWVATATKPNRRRSSVPDAASCGSGASADGEDEDEEMENRATLPRSVQSGPQTTNSLPRLPTTSVSSMQKAQSHQFLPQNVKSARYRPPGFSRLMPTQPKRAVSAPGLQPSHQRRGRRSQQSNVPSDDVSLSEAHSSPMLASRTGSKSATPSPVAPGSRRKTASVQEWPTHDDDIDRLVAMHHNRSSLSSLGLRSDSMASVYSGAGEGRYGSVAVRGQVEFGLQYNYKAGSLEIQIKQCKDLAPVDIKRNRSDPYVKVYLLPDKSKSGKRKTKVKKHTLNPVFDECLKFHMTLNELEIRTLWLSVWHSDMFGRNDFLGEVMMTLENKVFDDPTPKWYNLQERTEPFDDMLSFKGDIIVCLKFVPPDMTVHKKGKRSRGALHVLVKEAKGLTAVKANGSSDPFCKSYLLPDKGRSSKQKTPVVRRTVNPVWNYTFVYDDVTLQELAERSLELTVWDHDRLASNEFLGVVRFSLGTGKHYGKPVDWMDSTGKELNLWKSMLERPNFWVEGCLALRSTLIGTKVT